MNWFRTTSAIYLRELLAYFFSPIYYAATTIFTIVLGIAFWTSIRGGPGMPVPTADLSTVLATSPVLLIFVLPVVTMRLFSEEFRHGTIEPLMTAPVGDWQVVLSKYFAAITVLVAMFAPTLVFVATLYITGDPGPDPYKLLAGYLGVFLTGALFAALGVLASSLTKDQVVAAIYGIIFNFAFWLVAIATNLDYVRDTPWLKEAIEYVTFHKHFVTMVEGVLDSRDIIYFLSLTVFFLFATVRVVESRKWRV